MASPSDLPMPQNVDAERALLGAILEDNDALFDANKVLADMDFFEPWNANAYNLMRDVIEPGGRVSASTLMHDLSQNAIVDSDLTATDVIKVLVREAVPRSEVGTLAETIRELSRRRQAIAMMENAARELRAAPASVKAAEIRNKVDADFTALYTGVEEFGIRRVPDVGETMIGDIGRQMSNDNDPGISPGLAMIEDLTGTFMPGKLYILAGNSGSGKSALAQQICENVGERGGKVLMFQLEMSGEEVATRYLTARTGIPGRSISRSLINDEELRRLFDANMKSRGLPFYVDDTGVLTAATVESRCLRMKRIGGLHLAVVDHLQYLQSPERKMEEVFAVGPNLRTLKQAAKKLGIPFLVLAQLKGSFSEGPVRRPRISDLWNASAVEQNADAVIFVHRPEYMLRRNEPGKAEKGFEEWTAEVEKWAGLAEIILGKLREGQGWGVRRVAFDAHRGRFSDNADDALYQRATPAGALL